MNKVSYPTVHAIFEDWDDYDNLKKNGEDKNFFSFTEKWEIKYLKDKIKRHFPNLPAKDIADAIEYCCQTASPPYPRELFVAYVLGRFRIRVR
jgi:hypothetical protein